MLCQHIRSPDWTGATETLLPAPVVAELPGLYGPFSFPEKLLQRIWASGEFNLGLARTQEGRPVGVLKPGVWNVLAGPDFKGARLSLGGSVVEGDVEVHLRAGDWDAHGHAADAAYDRVVLHVVLFPGAEPWTVGSNGQRIPILSLLPLLWYDLEEYATDAAVETLAGRPLTHAQEVLAQLAPAALLELLQRHALERWTQKVSFASARIARLGWDDACHHAALEILGYRFNRAPMLAVAGRYRLVDWLRPEVAEDALAFQFERWQLHAVRPANHPLRRLRCYSHWVKAVSDWPVRMQLLARDLPTCRPEDSSGDERKRACLRLWRARWAQTVCAGQLGGTRLDNLLGDGLLPLVAANTSSANLFGLWYHGWPGDVPSGFLKTLRLLGMIGTPGHPVTFGLIQGLLGWMLAEEQGSVSKPKDPLSPDGGL